MKSQTISVLRRVAYSPFEALVASVLFASGLAFIAGGTPPTTVGSQLPHWLQLIWGGFLAIGGSLTIFGLLGPWHRLFGAGLYLLAGGISVYAAAILTAPHIHGGGLPAGIDFAIAVACILRAKREAALWTRP